MFYLLVVLCGLCLMWRIWSKKQSDLQPPVLSGWLPIVGHGHMLMGDGVKLYKSLVRMSEECTEKGGLVTIYLGLSKIYCITDPYDCLAVMNTCLQKSFFLEFGKQFLGNGLITADVQRWQTSRRLLNPAFNQKVLDGFIDIFNSKAANLVDKFASEVGKPFDHEILLRMNNLETICATSFDVHDKDCSDILKQYVPLFLSGMENISTRVQSFWLHNDFIYNMTGLKKDIDELVRKLVVLSKMIIQKKKTEMQNTRYKKIETGKPKKFIELILDLAEETGCFTDEQIREESDTLLIAGHDTVATTLTCALFLLGSHTDIQEKLYEEILRVCGNSNKSIEKEDLAKLVYTEAVLKEALRLYPIAIIMPRHIDKDVKLKNYTLKAGSGCFIMAHGLHRHSIWGPDADQFRPERWLDKSTLPDSKYYGAFGLGKRSCIGKTYATMSMKIILAHVLRRYRISSDISKLVLSVKVFIRPATGYFISLEQR